MGTNVQETTVNHDLCINCGICKAVCPHDCITMERNKFKEIVPRINPDTCTHCSICSRFCPNSKDTMTEEARKISSYSTPNTFGLDGENHHYYLAWNNNDEERIKSASGGVLTKLARHLLSEKIVDGVIHAERISGKTGENHAQACLSTTLEELLQRASSIYAPICFADVLEQLKPDGSYLMMGTPCVIRAAVKMFRKHKKFSGIKILTCALICSHNVNGQYTDYLAQTHKISSKTPYYVNLRNKDNLPDSGSFNNHYYTATGDLLKMNRYHSGFTHTWRSYYFAMNCCNYCADFWGYEADISVKDAWCNWDWVKDPLGKSIAIVRSEQMEQYLQACGIMTEPLDYETMAEHQKATSDFKQRDAWAKFSQPSKSPDNVASGFHANRVMSRVTKRLYALFGYRITKFIMPFVEKYLNVKSS